MDAKIARQRGIRKLFPNVITKILATPSHLANCDYIETKQLGMW